MQIPAYIYILGIIALLVVVGVFVLFLMRSRRVNLTKPSQPNEKPEWLKMDPPEETTSATIAEGEGVTLYNYDEGEHLASPFAEQIEDIVNASIKENPQLASTKIDLGTSPSGDIEFWVNDTKYDQIEDIPNEAIQEALHQAIEKWNQYMDSQK
jgi:hypothetical protein